MNLKKIIATLSFLLLLNCGYEPIYSKKQINSNYNYSINNINYIGDNKVNQILKNQLRKILIKEKKSIGLNLNLNSRLEKGITSKDKKGNPSRYDMSITMIVDVEYRENKTMQKTFTENFNYNTSANKFELSQYEKEIEELLIDKIIEDCITYLSKI